MPYLTLETCRDLGLLPGRILEATFIPVPNARAPHVEDMWYRDLRVIGTSTLEQFKQVLNASTFPGTEQGFGIKLPPGDRCVPVTHKGSRSIITLSVDPAKVKIVEDSYRQGKIKINFIDGCGNTFRYMPITDLGFHTYAMEHHNARDLDRLNRFLASQEELYLRIGLSREYTSPQGKTGYWMQVNGIYSFPDFPRAIRGYR